jgi:cbb3-type cytochrome oxidase cytochrome c subunit
MNYGPLIFLAAFFALASSWLGLVLTPQLQLGRLQPTNTIPDKVTYPLSRPGQAAQGLDVYRANGCAWCHSQQVRQSGTVCHVLLAEAGTNQAAVVRALLDEKIVTSESEAGNLLAKLPATVQRGPREMTDVTLKALQAAGAKADLLIVPVGPDISRGWGVRRSIAEDFLYDYPVMPGSQRIGPDLANVGARLSDPNWHFRHLYAPQAEVKGSVMPPYRYLFEKRRLKNAAAPDPSALPANLAVEPGFEIIPTPDAKSLVAYLLSLRADAALFEAPFKLAMSAPAPTNAPSATATNTPATNTPAK